MSITWVRKRRLTYLRNVTTVGFHYIEHIEVLIHKPVELKKKTQNYQVLAEEQLLKSHLKPLLKKLRL